MTFILMLIFFCISITSCQQNAGESSSPKEKTVITTEEANKPTTIPVGEINGQIMNAGDRKPIEGAQIILCEVLDRPYEHLICRLNGTPTAVSSNGGFFKITDIPIGTYFVMYGMPGLLKMKPEEWDGIDITRGTGCMQGFHNSVCNIEGVPPSEFWAEGASTNGISSFIYQEDELKPGVLIQATAKAGSPVENVHFVQGTIHSKRTGISANIMGGQYFPEIEVIQNEVITIEIQAPVK